MKTIVTLVGISISVLSCGCRMCDSSLDKHFASYGGIVERVHPTDGRVGSSVFPASAEVGRLTDEDPAKNRSTFADRPKDLNQLQLPPEDSAEPSQMLPDELVNPKPEAGTDSGKSVDDIINSIPDFDDQEYEDLLEQIPDDSAESGFPGEVNALPLPDAVGESNATAVAEAEKISGSDGALVSHEELAEKPESASSIIDVLRSVVE